MFRLLQSETISGGVTCFSNYAYTFSMEHEIENQISAASAVMGALYWTKLSWKAELLIYQLINVPALTYNCEVWVVVERMRLQIQMAEMDFLFKVAVLSLIDRVKNSDIQREQGVELLLLLVCDQDGTWTAAISGHIQLVGRPRVDPNHYLAQEPIGIPKDVESVAGEKDIWNTLPDILPL